MEEVMARQPCSIINAADGSHIFDYRDEMYGLYLIRSESDKRLMTASNNFADIVSYMENNPEYRHLYSVIDWRAHKWIVVDGKYI